MAKPMKTVSGLLAAAFAVSLLLIIGANARHLLKERMLQDSSITFVIAFNGQVTRAQLSDAVEAAAGCKLTWFADDAGLATARCPVGVVLSKATPEFAGMGVIAVALDVKAPRGGPDDEQHGPDQREDHDTDNAASATTASAATSENFYTGPLTGGAPEPNDPWWAKYQWAPRSIDAPAAWAKGINGRCVRVGVLGGNFGIFDKHPDLIHKFDYNASRSFIEGVPLSTPEARRIPFMTSGIIGAEAKNGLGTVGVAYGSTLVGVRIFDPTGWGADSDVVKAMYYAAQRRDKGGAGVDIIHIDGSDVVDRGNRSDRIQPDGSNALTIHMQAIAFANRMGVLIINDMRPGVPPVDVSKSKDTIITPCESANVLCVAASAPLGMCTAGCDQSNDNVRTYRCLEPLNFTGANYSQLAWYSNYGRVNSVTAPGGTFARQPKDCYQDDGIVVPSPSSPTSVTFAYGIFYATAHVSALAALYIQKAAMDAGVLESELCNPSRIKTFVSPGQIKAAILRGAVLPPGNAGEMKHIFGAGIINVKNTLGL